MLKLTILYIGTVNFYVFIKVESTPNRIDDAIIKTLAMAPGGKLLNVKDSECLPSYFIEWLLLFKLLLNQQRLVETLFAYI